MDNALAAAAASAADPRILSPNAPHLMGLDVTTIHVDRPLTNMIAGYVNREFVADQVMPVVTVSKRSDKYFQYDPAEMLSVMQTQLDGQRGMPNEISSHVAADGSYLVKDQALLYFVSADELTNADAPLRPMEIGNRKLHNALMLAREIRVAAQVFGAANYGAQTSALAGADRWDQTTSDPIAQLFTAIKSCLVRPTHLVINEQTETYLMNHPKVLQFILGRASTLVGGVPLYPNEELLAKCLGLQGVIVARAKYASQVEGQTFAQAYVYGKSAALIRVEPQPNISMTACFGYSFRFGAWETRVIPEFLHGVRGGSFLKQSHSDAENVVGAPYTSYLYTTVIS